MKSTVRIFVFSAALLSACSGTGVKSRPDGTLQMTAKASQAEGGVSAARDKALKAADKYCRSKGSQANIMGMIVEPAGPANGAATVGFICA